MDTKRPSGGNSGRETKAETTAPPAPDAARTKEARSPTSPTQPGGHASQEGVFPMALSLVRPAALRPPPPDSQREEACRKWCEQHAKDHESHAHARHGPQVKEAEHVCRVQEGPAADGAYAPTQKSTSFYTHELFKTTQETAKQAYAERLGKPNLFHEPPAPGEDKLHEIVHDHQTPVGFGYVGDPSSVAKVSRIADRRQFGLYKEVYRVDDITQTQTTVIWNPKANNGKGMWQDRQHHPLV